MYLEAAHGSLRSSPGKQLCSGGRCQPLKQRERRLQSDSAPLAYRLAPVKHHALIQRDVLSAAQLALPGTHAASPAVTFLGPAKMSAIQHAQPQKNPKTGSTGPNKQAPKNTLCDDNPARPAAGRAAAPASRVGRQRGVTARRPRHAHRLRAAQLVAQARQVQRVRAAAHLLPTRNVSDASGSHVRPMRPAPLLLFARCHPQV